MAKTRSTTKDATNNTKKKRTAICRVCEISFPYTVMKRVTTNREKLEEWKKILGPVFIKNISQNTYNRICLIDYKRLRERQHENMNLEDDTDLVENGINIDEENMAASSSSENGEVVPEERMNFEEHHPDIVEMVPIDTKHEIRRVPMRREPIESTEVILPEHNAIYPIVIKHEPLDEIQLRFANPENCRKCGAIFEKTAMIETPDTEELKIWVDILGWEFNKNLIFNSPPHFICNSDMKQMMSDLIKKHNTPNS